MKRCKGERVLICLGSVQGYSSDMRGSMLFPSERANIPHTAHKSQFTSWGPGLHPQRNELIVKNLEKKMFQGKKSDDNIQMSLLQLEFTGANNCMT